LVTPAFGGKGKAVRLCQEGLFSPNLPKHFLTSTPAASAAGRNQRSWKRRHPPSTTARDSAVPNTRPIYPAVGRPCGKEPSFAPCVRRSTERRIATATPLNRLTALRLPLNPSTRRC
jgi:hypothetical protein